MVDREITPSGTSADGGNGRRLIGWKAIGQFLGCTERTARRWEADRALPVHRIPGGGRSPVWANREELASWLRALPSDVQATLRAEAGADPVHLLAEAGSVAARAESVARQPGGAARRWSALIAACAFVALAVAGVVVWQSAVREPRVPQEKHGPYDDNAEARETYMTARFELATRSADSLAGAERGFRLLVERYPERAAGWSGLADTYLLQREFSALPDDVAYPQAARAARAALALDPKLADAWLDQAFVEWWWLGDSATAFRAFTTALQLDPNSAKGLHWYATALYAHGDYERSLEAIARARSLDPNSRAIVADQAWIRFGTGHQAEALATLERLTQLDPSFESGHFYLAQACLILRRDADFLREARAAMQLRGQTEAVAGLSLAEERFLSGGRQAMLDQLSASEAERVSRGSGSAVTVAAYRAQADDRDGMLRWLAVAEARHDHNLPSLPGYPEFSAYRSDPAFVQTLQRRH